MARYPVISNYPVIQHWCDLREAAQIYGEELQGKPVTIQTIRNRIDAGAFKTVRTISQHFVILRKSEVRADARIRRAQQDRAAARLPAGRNPAIERIDVGAIRERLAATPLPPKGRE